MGSRVNHVRNLMASNPEDWAEILERDYKIKITRDGVRASLKYDQIESPMREPIVQQCRGMVVDVERRVVLAWPYDKFWNHGEAMAEKIDWSSARMLEKLDGSLMIMYWNRDCADRDERGWSVGSSGHPTAGGRIAAADGAPTFRDAFWAMAESFGMNIEAADPDLTYMFELCDTPNRIVVRYDRPRLVLHGARDLETGHELGRDALTLEAMAMGVEIVDEVECSSVAACLAASEALDPVKQEGFVVVDSSSNRIKVKSPRYVILHHMLDKATVRHAVDLWKTGEAGEILAHFPELAVVITPVHAELDRIAAQAVVDFAENIARPTRKDFALAVKERPWATVLFRMADGAVHDEASARAIMRNMSTAALERMLTP